MNPRRAVALRVAAMLALITTTWLRWRRPDVARVTTLTIPAVRVEQALSNDTPLDSIGSAIASHDPFRLANTPSRTRYATTAQSMATVSSPVRDPRPAMTLKAIAGGPPWQALIDGVPGQTRAVLVHSGTVLDRLSIGAITRNGVVVRGTDTTWVLSFSSRP